VALALVAPQVKNYRGGYVTVKAIRLQNFMAFRDTGWVELHPITLLFGRNSSGKSTILRALRLLRQSLNPRANDEPLIFTDENGIDLGEFASVVHDQDKSKSMVFGFRCGPLKYLREIRVNAVRRNPAWRAEVTDEADWAEIELAFSLGDDDTVQLVAVHVAALSGKDDQDRLNILGAYRLDAELSRLFNNDEWYLSSDCLSPAEDEELRNRWTGVNISRISGFLPQLSRFDVRAEKSTWLQEELWQAESLLGEIREEIRDYLARLVFLDAIRPESQRVYTFDRSTQKRWELHGLEAFLKFLSGRLPPDQLAEIDHWLVHLDLGVEARAIRRSSADAILTEFQVQLRERGVGLAINLSDVGVGAAQILPIIIQMVVGLPGTAVVGEQPELHLHPRAQARLGDLFIAAKQRGVNCIIETHSEHLLLRLQKQIARTTAGEIPSGERGQMLLPNQLAVYFVNRKDGVSTTTQIEVGPYGDLLSTPEGFEDFFSDDMIETAERMRVRLASMRKDG
jgi:predicted ATPase